MRQFIQSDPGALAPIVARARRACVRFRDREMPAGCQPDRADVGFEIDEASGEARLHVQRGIRYSGRNPDVAEWVRVGTKRFPSFDALVGWVRGSLSSDYEAAGAAGEMVERSPRDARSLTDMPEVFRGVKQLKTPMYLDEEELFARLISRVRGQDDAMRSLAAAVARHCARCRPTRPAVLFAIGPSGVGKTRSAETLAETLREMDSESRGYQFLRLDMSEYQEAHRVSQMIGSPQGYVGHGEGSQLLDALRANPRCIILFDEIEKAHPAILRVLMNAMDAGRLSSASRQAGGREIDCREAIFLFTSNIDSRALLDEMEAKGGFGNRVVEDEVCRRRLRAAGVAPEIVGRIARFLVFGSLSAETRAEIMASAIVDVAAEYGVSVSYIEPEVVLALMRDARSEGFGVRPGQFMIDDALGGAFAAAARNGAGARFRVKGPPFECVAET